MPIGTSLADPPTGLNRGPREFKGNQLVTPPAGWSLRAPAALQIHPTIFAANPGDGYHRVTLWTRLREVKQRARGPTANPQNCDRFNPRLSLLKRQTATVSSRKGTVAGHRYFPAEAPVGTCQQPPVWEQERAGGFCLDDDSLWEPCRGAHGGEDATCLNGRGSSRRP